MKKMSIVPFTEEDLGVAARMAETFALSGFFRDAGEKAQAMVKIIAGAELRMTPFQSMSGLHVIEGKVELSANLMAAKVKGSAKYDYRVRANTAEECSIEFFENNGGPVLSNGKGNNSLGISTFTMKQARDGGLCMGKAGMKKNWKVFPAAMLFARALSAGVRMFCPDAITAGAPIYVDGEISGREVDPDGRPLETAEVTVVDQSPEKDGELPASFGESANPTKKPSETSPTGSTPKAKRKAKAKAKPKKAETVVDPTPAPESSATTEGAEGLVVDSEAAEDTTDALCGVDPEPEDQATNEDGEEVLSRAGLTHEAWSELSDEELNESGMTAQATINLIGRKAKELGRGSADISTFINANFAVQHLWQLSKSEAMQVLNTLIGEIRKLRKG